MHKVCLQAPQLVISAKLGNRQRWRGTLFADTRVTWEQQASLAAAARAVHAYAVLDADRL